MKRKIANYTVIIEEQTRIGTNEKCFVASVPKLGITTDAHTSQAAEKAIQEMVQFHLESLAEENNTLQI